MDNLTVFDDGETLVHDDRRLTGKPLLKADEVVAVARLCLAVYLDKPRVEGWYAVGCHELGLDDGFANGTKYVNRNAAAFVRETDVNGERTLVVAFKGTDPASPLDWAHNIIDVELHYHLMQPLVSAIDRYVERNGIKRVIAAGHSLGGAMAELFMKAHRVGAAPGVEYVGCTFGSPGARFEDGYTDRRILEFRHAEDIVPRIGRLPLIANYAAPGRLISLDDERRHEGLSGPLTAHCMADYVRSLVTLRRDGALDQVLARPDDVTVSWGRHGGAITPATDVNPWWSMPTGGWLTCPPTLAPEPRAAVGFGL